MNAFELGVSVGFTFLCIALAIMSFKLAKHERHFANIQEILLIAGMKIHNLSHQVEELQNKKESVVND